MVLNRFDEISKIKKENARKMRLARARIPEKYVIETFPFNRQPKLNKKIRNSLKVFIMAGCTVSPMR